MEYVSPDSYWLHSTDRPPAYPPLAGDATADVAVIGAGITGLTAADLLVRAGRKVVVLEANRVGGGTTGGTSGHLDCEPGAAATLVKSFGEEAARLVAQGRRRAIESVRTRAAELGSDCEFVEVDGYRYTERPDHADKLRQKLDACGKLGLNVTIGGIEIGLPFPTAFAVRFLNQARFQPVAYLRDLAAAIVARGGAILEQTRAKPPSGGDPATVETDRGTVTAKAVIVATHSPYLGLSPFDLRVAAYQSYVLAVRVEKTAADALYWDDEDPYHYIRRANSDDANLLIVGGEDHKTGQCPDERDRFAALEDYARRRFGALTVERRWSAELFESDDGLPFVGAVPLAKNVYLATGFGGEGLSYGPLAGELLADLVLGRENPLAVVLSPSRVKPLAEAKNFVVENANVAKEFVKGKLFDPEKVASLKEVAAGTGRLVSYNGQTLAVYRDDAGVAHALSAVCTHAGCNVHWNDAERTWDCPCHGGRYAATGERLYGPPPADLKRQPWQES